MSSLNLFFDTPEGLLNKVDLLYYILKLIVFGFFTYRIFGLDSVSTTISILLFSIYTILNKDGLELDIYIDLYFLIFFTLGYCTTRAIMEKNRPKNKNTTFKDKLGEILFSLLSDFFYTVTKIISIIILFSSIRGYLLSDMVFDLSILSYYNYIYTLFLSWVPFIYFADLFGQWLRFKWDNIHVCPLDLNYNLSIINQTATLKNLIIFLAFASGGYIIKCFFVLSLISLFNNKPIINPNLNRSYFNFYRMESSIKYYSFKPYHLKNGFQPI